MRQETTQNKENTVGYQKKNTFIRVTSWCAMGLLACGLGAWALVASPVAEAQHGLQLLDTGSYEATLPKQSKDGLPSMSRRSGAQKGAFVLR